MRPLQLIIRSLWHFRKRNIFLAAGIAISTAVLTGALIVGDSVKHSLQTIAEQRLGNVQTIMLSGDRFFSGELAVKLKKELQSPVSGILMLDGMALNDGGQKRINRVQVVGTDATFDEIAGQTGFYSQLNDDSVIVSSNLAQRLGVIEGDEFLLRMTKASLVPLNAPFVSDADNIVTLRVAVKAIAGASELGTFNIQNSQTAPFNIFISANRLRELMEIGNRCNLLLVANKEIPSEELTGIIKNNWVPADAGLLLKYHDDLKVTQVISERVFFDDTIAATLISNALTPQPLLTYFVNTIELNERSTPYSFVAGYPGMNIGEDEIIINSWLADDLQAGRGDLLTISYFTVGPLRELAVDSAVFRVKSIVPVDNPFTDERLMPDIPGLSDAGNCRDWETGIPIALESIRDKDEDYWTRYSGTPKAFISVEMAEKLWQNRFGTYTAFRFETSDTEQLGRSLMDNIDPGSLGFEIRQVRSSAKYASENGVDFSQLFGGLSFFLLAGALMLSVLLFLLNLAERKEQIRTLSAIGIPFKTIRKIIAAEGLAVAVAGALAGLLLAIAYNRLIFFALNSIWMDIVRTSMLEVNIQGSTLAIGFIASMVIAAGVIWFPLGKFIRKTESRHILKTTGSSTVKRKSGMIFIAASLSGLIAVGLILLQFLRNEVANASLFFVAGALLLISGLLFAYGTLRMLNTRSFSSLTIPLLSLKNSVTNMQRSMSIIILFAIGTFIVISTGSNKKDLFVNADEKTSGTGGFLFYAESTIPVLKNLNSEVVRFEFGLDSDYSILQIRVAEGDDASCLNLNRIVNPSILGVNPERLHGRFSFVTSVAEFNHEVPWSTLNSNVGPGLIPAIADETVIKWGLGMKVGDTLKYQDAQGNELKLLLVGGMAPSIFQGNVLIAEEMFLKHFPSSSGTEIFLVEGEMADTAQIGNELAMGLRDFGWTMEYTAARLAEFNSVTNTYLSIFLVLGALGLLLGTVGLSIVLSRSILERTEELGLLRAVGFGLKSVKNMVIREYFLLLVAGTLVGAVASVIATLPSFMSENTGVSITTVFIIIAALIANGLLWIWWMTGLFLRGRGINSALRRSREG